MTDNVLMWTLNYTYSLTLSNFNFLYGTIWPVCAESAVKLNHQNIHLLKLKLHYIVKMWNMQILFQQFTTCLYFQMLTQWMAGTFSGLVCMLC